MLRFVAGNVDDRKFTLSEECRVSRGNVRTHLTFGTRIHNCQSAPLVRTELATTFRAMANLPGDFALKDGARSLKPMDAFCHGLHMARSLAFSSPSNIRLDRVANLSYMVPEYHDGITKP